MERIFCLAPVVAAMLVGTAGCSAGEPAGEGGAAGAPLPMPKALDVAGSAHRDLSCACLLSGVCANLADGLPGHWEARKLECRVASQAERTVRCTFERRFVEGDFTTPLRHGPWRRHSGLYHNYGGKLWCAR